MRLLIHKQRPVLLAGALAALMLGLTSPVLAAIDQPAVPDGELGCYYVLGVASGQAHSASSDRSISSKKRQGATQARAALRWYQQWYLARLSAWPSDRHEPAISRAVRARVIKLPPREVMRRAMVCINWAQGVTTQALKDVDTGK